ncbi:hypothetical protein BH11ACT6_BH11ACT6_01720 [soil metagenome]
MSSLRDRLPQKAVDLLDGATGKYTTWDTVCAVAMHMMNAGFTEDEFIAVVSGSDLAEEFVTENGRTRLHRLESRLSKVWSRAYDAWDVPLGSAEDVRHKLEALFQRLDAHRWSGRTAGSDRAVSLALVAWAHEIGVWTLDASTRDTGVRAGVSHGTAKKALHRLESLGVIRKEKERTGTHAQRWVLQLGWGLRDITDPHDLAIGGKGLCGSIKDLTHPAFLRSALGQTSERVWLDLMDHPDSTAAEIADRLGTVVKTVRRALDEKLIPNQLAGRSGTKSNGRCRPSTMFRINTEGQLNQIAEDYGVSDWHTRTAERYRREREGYRAMRQKQETQTQSDPFSEDSPAGVVPTPEPYDLPDWGAPRLTPTEWWRPDPFA